VLEQQKQEDICSYCKREINSLIIIKKIKMHKNSNYWEAENDSTLEFHCPHCYSEIDISKLKTKKVVF
jgi:hypothetical protein